MRTAIICDPLMIKSQTHTIPMKFLKRKRSNEDTTVDINDHPSKVIKKCEQTIVYSDLQEEISHNNGNQLQLEQHHVQNSHSDDCLTIINNSVNDNLTNNHTIEYVNVMFDNNLLPVQNPIITEANVVNLNELSACWSNSDLLNLDEKINSNIITNCYNETNNVCGDGSGDYSTQSTPNHSTQNTLDLSPTEDIEDKNLSWLFNFKLDELPHLSPEVNRHNRTSTGKKVDEIIQEVTSGLDEEELNVAENIIIETTPRLPKKPPFTYTELIEYALEDRGELTVSGIYQWISDRFPFYKSNDDRWKNSVRHNLSINPHFRKGNKAPQGAGHLWTISSRDSEANTLAWEHKKQRLELFFKMEATNASNASKNSLKNQTAITTIDNDANNIILCYDETAAATASIMLPQSNSNIDEITETTSPDQHQLIDSQQQIVHNHHNHLVTHNHNHHELINHLEQEQHLLQQHQQEQTINSYHQSQQHVEHQTVGDNQTVDDLRRTAGEILNGIRRNVEVQIINHQPTHHYHGCILESGDYLNPVPKDQIVQECGLRGSSERQNTNDLLSTVADSINGVGSVSDYYVTEIDPIELGINMTTDGDEEVLFGDDFNLNYFGMGNNIMA